ncbi:MAG: AraC family transcriptional regulator [Ignavibacteriaceae bacterium]
MIRTKNSSFNYLTSTDTDKLWGLYITGCGCADIPPNSKYPPTQHPDTYMFDWSNGRVLPEFQILYITHGEGIFETKKSGKKKVGAGSILLLFPGIWHRYQPSSKTGWKEYWISFNGSQPDIFMKNGILPENNPVLEIGLSETLISLYHQILELIESEKIGYKEIISTLTYQIIAQVNTLQNSKRFAGKEIENTIQKAKAYIADNIDSEIKFETLASELGIGYSWFRRMFRHYTGLAPTQYFLQLKLNKAKELVIGTSLSIKQISVMLGFESQYYFSKIFKKKTGMSPIQLRNYSQKYSPH